MTEYPLEILDAEEDDGTMVENVEALAAAVVAPLVSVERSDDAPARYGRSAVTLITLDDGTTVELADTDDCCAYTAVEEFLLHVDRIDHLIMGVGTTDGYTRWHIFADFGDVMEVRVGWSAGNPFYYGYGFDIVVKEAT